MSYIRKHKSTKGYLTYEEVESYRDGDGKKQHRVLRNLGNDLPEEYRKGHNGDVLKIGKHIQVFKVKSISMIDFMEQTGIIKEYKRQRGVEYALVIFDEPIRKRDDWLIPFEYLGNIKKDGIGE